MADLEKLVSDLRNFDRKREVLSQLKKEIRKPVPQVRKAIRARAVATLPGRGGLGKWVAKASITAQFKSGARSLGIKLKGSRKSSKDKSDLKRIDAGQVRAPSWGRRSAGSWHTQAVTPGYFTKPATETDAWRQAAETAIENAAEVIARG